MHGVIIVNETSAAFLLMGIVPEQVRTQARALLEGVLPAAELDTIAPRVPGASGETTLPAPRVAGARGRAE